jgi:hypothetical protein
MSGLKELLIDLIKLTDEVQKINQVQDRMQAVLTDVDKRVVRLETIVEIASTGRTDPKLIR